MHEGAPKSTKGLELTERKLMGNLLLGPAQIDRQIVGQSAGVRAIASASRFKMGRRLDRERKSPV